MYPSIATVCLSGTLQEKIAAISAAGFKHVEIFENDLLSFDGSIKEAASLISDHGLNVVTLQPFRDFEGLQGKHRQLAFDRARLKFDQMNELGTDLLMVCSSTHPNASGGISRLASDFHELGELAKQRGMRVAYEALAWGTHINDYRDSWEIVRQADHESVGVVLDTFHIFSRGTDLSPIRNIPGDRIFLVQTADAPSLSMDHLSWSRHYRCFPGQGELTIDAFMEVLACTGYQGALSHEIFNDIFRRSDPLQTAMDGFRSSQFLLSMLPQKNTEVPAPTQLSGFDFVEIATQSQHLNTLQVLLTAIGFQRVGEHRDMRAEHWRCGDVQFVLNTDPDFANKFLERRGTGVVALGLKVDNTYACTKRANFLGVPIVEPEQVDALHNMVGMKNVDGTVWYWVDASTSQHAFDTAFNSVDRPVNDASIPMITQIDHISLSQSYPDFLSTLLSFRSLFELNIAPAFDVFDPQGLIQSQVIHNDDFSFQLAFNATEAKSTTSARFIERANGSGVQHIALQTTDIVNCAQVLVDAGIDFIRIPENYYPDMQARFGLEDSVVETLAQLNILYDEDERGSFYQLYTQPIDGRFYFEFVQRDGYRGLGAANAWLRASAQQLTVVSQTLS
jgi:4-hydroxyphenylpyruvate dioxygenase